MAIEDLKTKEDLSRFIVETFEQQPLNTIRGLPNELAITLRAEVDQLEVTIPEGQKVSAPVLVPHALGVAPRHISFVIADESGENTYGFRILARTEKDFTFVMNAAVAAGAGGLSRMVEWAAFRGGEMT